MFYCKCGEGYAKSIELRQHIGLLNAHWPRSSPDDKHGLKTVWRCSCGLTFDAPHRLANHVGYAILRDDNADHHKEVTNG